MCCPVLRSSNRTNNVRYNRKRGGNRLNHYANRAVIYLYIIHLSHYQLSRDHVLLNTILHLSPQKGRRKIYSLLITEHYMRVCYCNSGLWDDPRTRKKI